MDLSKTILSDLINRWFFSQSKTGIYLVGGYLRDLIRGRAPKDKDYVVSGDAERLARKMAHRFKGTFILLKEGQTCRVVLRDKSIIDINFLREHIKEDLLRRDFRINAIAWSPMTGILDPSGGIIDISRRLIRPVRDGNLKKDPLRLLRAYRLSAELRFTINNNTRRFIKNHSNLILQTASERITDEFIKILNHTDAGKYLKLCCRDGLLEKIINIEAKLLSANLIYIKRFDLLNKRLRIDKRADLSPLSQGLTSAGLMRLTALLNGSGGFKGVNTKLKLSRANTIASGKTLSAIYSACSCKVNKRNLYRIFKKAEERSIEAAILISIIKRRDTETLIRDAIRFISIRNRPLLSGDDIQEMLDIGPGNKIGDYLTQLEEERFHRNIRSKAEGRRWIMSNLT